MEEEDKVVTLLGSLPERYMLTENNEVPCTDGGCD